MNFAFLEVLGCFYTFFSFINFTFLLFFADFFAIDLLIFFKVLIDHLPCILVSFLNHEFHFLEVFGLFLHSFSFKFRFFCSFLLIFLP